MDLLTTATTWARAEVFSARFFILAALLFLAASLGFYRLGLTAMARAYIVPTLVAGVLLLAVGVGIYYANGARVTRFAEAHQADAGAFVETELARTERVLAEYRRIVFGVIPLIIVAAALVIVLVERDTWRATAITTIAMMVVIFLVDTNANARITAYHELLLTQQTSN